MRIVGYFANGLPGQDIVEEIKASSYVIEAHKVVGLDAAKVVLRSREELGDFLAVYCGIWQYTEQEMRAALSGPPAEN